MRRFGLGLGMLMLAITATTARADVTFSNIMIHGSLSTGGTATPDPMNGIIDFSFPNARVGDGLPARVGNIVLTYEATSTMMMEQNQLLLNALGALSGSGTIYFNEVIEDLISPGIIASYNVVLDMNSDLPHNATLNFSRATTHIKVKKTLVLTAVDTPGIDLADASLVEQTITPEPGVIALLLLGVPLLRRR